MLTGPRAWAGELIGTYVFFTTGMASIVITTSGLAGYGTFGVAAAHGLALAVMVTIFMGITGAHFNPAVTLVMWISRRIAGRDALGYVAAQVAAGLAAAGTVRMAFAAREYAVSDIGLPALGLGVSPVRGVAIEAVLTFFLLIAIWGTGVDERGATIGGFGIGLTVFVDILAGGGLTGAAMNPARWIGPAVVSGSLGDAWVYFVGPALGALASLVYPVLYLGGLRAERS